MAIQVKAVSSKKEMKTFVRFANRLYKDNRYYVPSMPSDDMATFDKGHNGAFAFSEAELYLAYKDGEVAGRVAAIINHKANEAWGVKQVRFGWIDFIDDIEVSGALLEAVIAFGRKHGMTQIVGPLGFTDFDPEGMLVEGFDRISTMALIYNHPYYPEHMKKHGYFKETGWVEYRITLPEELPERHKKLAELVKERYNLKIVKKTRKHADLLEIKDLSHDVLTLVDKRGRLASALKNVRKLIRGISWKLIGQTKLFALLRLLFRSLFVELLALVALFGYRELCALRLVIVARVDKTYASPERHRSLYIRLGAGNQLCKLLFKHIDKK